VLLFGPFFKNKENLPSNCFMGGMVGLFLFGFGCYAWHMSEHKPLPFNILSHSLAA